MTQIESISEVVEDVRALTFRGPIDDLDAHTSFCLQCRHLLIQLQRLASPLLPDPDKERLQGLDVYIDDVYSAFKVQSELDALVPVIETALSHVDGSELSDASLDHMILPSVIDQIRQASSSDFDTTVLARRCREINSCFCHGNIVATALTMRAVLNYVPPIFGQKTFDQVLAHSDRSLKESFKHLHEGLRKIADLHAHRPIRKKDIYPSAHQVEPFKAPFEILLHEILSRLTRDVPEHQSRQVK